MNPASVITSRERAVASKAAIVAIVERILSQHWEGFGVCDCWICTEGHTLGCHARSEYLPHNGDPRPFVGVEGNWTARSSRFGKP